jgi:hypothetical protein
MDVSLVTLYQELHPTSQRGGYVYGRTTGWAHLSDCHLQPESLLPTQQEFKTRLTPEN